MGAINNTAINSNPVSIIAILESTGVPQRMHILKYSPRRNIYVLIVSTNHHK